MTTPKNSLGNSKGMNMAKVLWSLQVENFEHKRFTPYHRLVGIFTRDSVISLLQREASIPFHRRDELTNAVLDNGLRLLAILIEIDEVAALERFLELDNFAGGHYDSKLPISKAELKNVFQSESESYAVDQFFSKQWAYIAPHFYKDQSCRTLDSRAILPFEEVKKPELASPGAFSAISIVHVYNPDSAAKTAAPRTLVWKRIVHKREESRLEDDFSRERDVLSMLRCIGHPNIIQLYTAFVKNGEFSLLMPLAECDLGRLLNGHVSSVQGLETPTDICSALWGLASGLQVVHSYHAHDFGERRIGCHYDIKPPNILCMQGRLVLSDFGLSVLRPQEEGSQLTFQHVNGSYVAPECLKEIEETHQEGPERSNAQRIGRASDIWSLACVLCEVLAFLKGQLEETGGPEIVQEFRKDRKIRRQGHLDRIWQRFHDGIDLNPAALKLLCEFQAPSSDILRVPEYMGSLAAVVADGLKIEPRDRVDAEIMASSLLHLALRITYLNITTKITSHSFDPADHFGFYVEVQRIATWADEIGLGSSMRTSPTRDMFPSYSHDRAKMVEETLGRISIEIGETLKRLCSGAGHSSDICYSLRRLVDELWDTQPITSRQRMHNSLEEKILDSSCSFNQSSPCDERSALPLGNSPSYHRLAVLTVAKAVASRLGTLANNPSSSSPTLPRELGTSTIRRPLTSFHWHYLSVFEPTGQKVLIETTEYDTEWANRVDCLIERVQYISQLRHDMMIQEKPLGAPPERSPIIQPMLRSLGFLHDATRHRFGIVYELPVSTTGIQDPVSLHTIITKTQSRAFRPSLTQKFALASALAGHLLDLHRIRWLHKSLCSFNIIFFPDDDSKTLSTLFETGNITTDDDNNNKGSSDQQQRRLSKLLSQPYFIGFGLARFSSDTAFSRGPRAERQLQEYQHPVYLRAATLLMTNDVTTAANSTTNSNFERYRQEFDYYSIGLVLIEIAFWQPLAKITEKIKGSPEQVRRALLSQGYLGLVASYMGDRYAEVVRRCLCFYHDVVAKQGDRQQTKTNTDRERKDDRAGDESGDDKVDVRDRATLVRLEFSRVVVDVLGDCAV
ncbi:putative cyclin-dependent kinase 1 [Naviculisporaceae sp. PSN 640]